MAAISSAMLKKVEAKPAVSASGALAVRGRILGKGEVVEITVTDGKILAIDALPNPSEQERQLVILPGLVDLHTHLREPGGERSETIATGSKAAAAGGYTCVFAMANTDPVSDTASSVETTRRVAEEVGLVDVQPIGAVTKGQASVKMADLGSMHQSEAKVTVFSDDGKCVSDSLVMRHALEYVSSFGGVIAQHSQDPRLTEAAQMNEGKLSSKLGLQGWPGVAEESIIARDILLAELTGARLHICHLTTANAVKIVRFAKEQLKLKQQEAKARGEINAKILKCEITAEATPHHLNLTEELLDEYNPRFKVNPPLRTAEDVAELRRGVIDGTIDIIGTDHAPHALELKYCNFQDSAFGMTGLETSLRAVHKALVLEGVDGKTLSWEEVARILSYRPAEIGKVQDRQGFKLEVGSPANICVYNPSKKPEPVSEPEKQFTRSTNTPFKRVALPGEVVQTVYRGKITYTKHEEQG